MKDRIFTLKNGLRVANFSSPHPFTFTDGTVIPAVGRKKAEILMLNVEENLCRERDRKFRTIKLDWSLSDAVSNDIDWWMTYYNLKTVDVVLVPLPVMTALHAIWSDKDILKSPFRVIRVANRILKTIETNKFCI